MDRFDELIILKLWKSRIESVVTADQARSQSALPRLTTAMKLSVGHEGRNKVRNVVESVRPARRDGGGCCEFAAESANAGEKDLEKHAITRY